MFDHVIFSFALHSLNLKEKVQRMAVLPCNQKNQSKVS